MKKWIALFLVMMMTLSLTAALANTDKPKHQTTIDFIAKLEEEDMNYSFDGMQSTGNEVVNLPFSSDTYGDVNYRFFFNKECNISSIRVWNIIDFDAASRAEVLDVCNKLNDDWKFVKFVLDDSDNSVTVSFDNVLPETETEEVTWVMFLRMHNIIKDAYPELAPFAKETT